MRKVVNIFKQIFKKNPASGRAAGMHTPTIIKRDSHCISRRNISPAALKVLYRLNKSGYEAYLVGGGVRDLLLGQIPKDFDVVTDAHPEQIQELFRNSYIIGRRFKLVHVRFGREIIEVATFRGNTNSPGRIQTQHGLLLRDNVYGTLEDDVWRRDFTVNALYYNIADFSVVDFTGGIADLAHKSVRVIGDPIARYREDPARMLRALRFAGKLGFDIDEDSARPIKESKELLLHIPPARLFDKMLKIFHSGKSLATYRLLQSYEVFPVLFPQVAQAIGDETFANFIEVALKNTDERVSEDKGINSAFLFAVLLWGPLLNEQRIILEEDIKEYAALHQAMTQVIQQQLKIISIPRKYITVIREIWNLQYHLEHASPKRIYKVFFHPKFRAAYDFLLLRNASNELHISELFQWWTEFQDADEETRAQLIKSKFVQSKRRRRKKSGVKNDRSLSSAGE